MLDTQIEDFASRARFVDAVLGLLSVTESVRALAEVPRGSKGGGRLADGPLVEVLLGIVSVGRSLRATLGLAGSPPARELEPDPGDATNTGPKQRMLR